MDAQPKLTLLRTARELVREHNFDGQSLREAIPYLNEFNGKTFVLKIGGSVLNDVMSDQGRLPELVSDIVFLKKVGIKTILVHGGAKQMDARMKAEGLVPEKVRGLRVTTPRVLELAHEVFVDISNSIKKEIERLGYQSVVLHKDSGLVKSVQRDPALQCVGEPVSVDVAQLHSLDDDVIPVIPAVTASADDNAPGYNVNADDVASAIAAGISAEKLILMTDIEGVLDANGQLLSSLSETEVQALIEDGTIHGGMLPKVGSCLNALAGGVHKAHIIKGDDRAFMDEILTDHGCGTEFVNLSV